MANDFQEAADEVVDYFVEMKGMNERNRNWSADYAIIRLYREFELLMLGALSGAINNDASTISETVGCTFPKHLSQPVCEYLITGNGYFDFRGRDGLLKTVKEFIPATHILVQILKKPQYKESLERLSALRNFAAHDSAKAKASAREAIGGEKIGSAGSWLRIQDRFTVLVDELKSIAQEIHAGYPY